MRGGILEIDERSFMDESYVEDNPRLESWASDTNRDT